jgi:hypothetical protein
MFMLPIYLATVSPKQTVVRTSEFNENKIKFGTFIFSFQTKGLLRLLTMELVASLSVVHLWQPFLTVCHVVIVLTT